MTIGIMRKITKSLFQTWASIAAIDVTSQYTTIHCRVLVDKVTIQTIMIIFLFFICINKCDHGEVVIVMNSNGRCISNLWSPET